MILGAGLTRARPLAVSGGAVAERACIGVDVGGTFTDLARIGPDGLEVLKLPSSPADPSEAVVEGLRRLDPRGVVDVVHGTTVATNALLERRGARTAFVTTAGFGDLLALGRGERRDLYQLAPRPRPLLVPADLTFEVAERVAADGTILRTLRPAAAARVARRVAAAGAEAAAVCLLFSYLAPGHERRVGDALAGVAGGPGFVSLSVDVLPEFREYERASTVVVNAYVGPRVSAYLEHLAAATQPRRITVMGSHAGTLRLTEAARLPVATVLSGPAAGVLGAVAVAERCGCRRVLTLDMGGTSTDVALCDGRVPFTAAVRVDDLPIHRPAVDVHTVGAGGGSILRVDAGGALRVGPESAGAVPGPAAYRRGGRAATVTDAHVVLGRLPFGQPLAGDLRLDPTAARQAIAAVAADLGLSVEATALGALAVANATMERALRTVSIERGHDPRDFVLVAFGGAGPLHACELADLVRAEAVLVPGVPGALSALGLATASPLATTSRSVLRPPGAPPADVAAVFVDLEAEARRSLGAEEPEVERWVDVRYAGQSWELSLPWPGAEHVLAAFAAAHERRYGYARRGTPVEVVTLRVHARLPAPVVLPPPAPPRLERPTATRLVLADGRTVDAPVWSRQALRSGEHLVGPAVVAQLDATTYVAPGWCATVGRWGDLRLERRAAP